MAGFLDALTESERASFEARGTRRRYPRGAFLFTEGARSDHVVVVLAGRVKVSSSSPEGREIGLTIRGPGDLIGELGALDGAPRSAAVSALEPVEALRISREDFRALLAERPRAALLILDAVVPKLREATRRRIEYGSQDVSGRVATILLELADRYGEATPDGIRIDLPFTQEELAGLVASSRIQLTRALGRFRQRGFITTARRRIVILDADALRHRAG
jgi:CRP-like cAMP-binding protein